MLRMRFYLARSQLNFGVSARTPCTLWLRRTRKLRHRHSHGSLPVARSPARSCLRQRHRGGPRPPRPRDHGWIVGYCKARLLRSSIAWRSAGPPRPPTRANRSRLGADRPGDVSCSLGLRSRANERCCWQSDQPGL